MELGLSRPGPRDREWIDDSNRSKLTAQRCDGSVDWLDEDALVCDLEGESQD